MLPRLERRVWKQTTAAFQVDRWLMAGVRESPLTVPLCFATMAQALEVTVGKRIFMIPPGRTPSIDLTDFDHPGEAVYVFGNASQNLVSFIREDDAVVSIKTPHSAVLFGHCALPIVLYDRLTKL